MTARGRPYPGFVSKFGNKTPDFRGRFLRGLSPGKTAGQKVAHSLAAHSHAIPEHTHEFDGQLASSEISGGTKIREVSASLPENLQIWNGTYDSFKFNGNGEQVKPMANQILAGVYNWTEEDDGDARFDADWFYTSNKERNGYYSHLYKFVMRNIADRTALVVGTAGDKYIPGGDPTNGSRPVSNELRNSLYIKNLVSAGSQDFRFDIPSSTVTGRIDNKKVNGKVKAVSFGTNECGGSETAPDHVYVRYAIKVK